MTLQQIRYFTTAAQCGSISAAARKLFVAQSSISEAVKEIEKTYGITAFTRQRRGVSLTRDGGGPDDGASEHPASPGIPG